MQTIVTPALLHKVFWGGGYVQARDQPLACFLGFLLGTSGTSGRKPGNETTLRLTLVSHPQSTMQCDCTSGGHG